jgi:hypothetical protein
MSFPTNSHWYSDGPATSVIFQRYVLTEMPLEQIKSWSNEANPKPDVFVFSKDIPPFQHKFPNNTIFVRFPVDQPPGQPGGYLSVLAQDIDDLIEVNDRYNYNIEMTFFKGCKVIHDEEKHKSNVEKAESEAKYFHDKENVHQLLADIKHFEKLNDTIEKRFEELRPRHPIKDLYRIEFLQNEEKLIYYRDRVKELNAIIKDIYKKYEITPDPKYVIKPPSPIDRSTLNLLFRNPDGTSLLEGGKKRSSKTRTTRKRNIRGRRSHSRNVKRFTSNKRT